MLKKKEFDNIIKNNLIDATKCDCFGYVLSKTHSNYYSKEAFRLFLKEMQLPCYKDIFHSYDVGKGSELKEQNGRYGKMPPKMASVASSSRFCYLALRDGAEGLGGSGCVKFEYECIIKGVLGNAPQLDAYIPNENIYIEAKCHEIFDSHRIVMKEKYWDLIFGDNNNFGFNSIEKAAGKTFEIPLTSFCIEKSSSMFDIKQLICHLLGIASQKNQLESAKLVYMFFKPKVELISEQQQIDEVFYKLQDEIIKIFKSNPIQKFIKNNNIQLMAVAEHNKVMEQISANNIITLSIA